MNTHKFIQRVNDTNGFHCLRYGKHTFAVVNILDQPVIKINVIRHYFTFNDKFTMEQWHELDNFKQLANIWHKYYQEINHWKPLKDKWFKNKEE